jgi:hypothetical protein
MKTMFFQPTGANGHVVAVKIKSRSRKRPSVFVDLECMALSKTID